MSDLVKKEGTVGEESWTQHKSKKFSASLMGSTQAKVSLWRNPTSCRNELCMLSHRMEVAHWECGLSASTEMDAGRVFSSHAPHRRRHEWCIFMATIQTYWKTIQMFVLHSLNCFPKYLYLFILPPVINKGFVWIYTLCKTWYYHHWLYCGISVLTCTSISIFILTEEPLGVLIRLSPLNVAS